MMNNLPQQLDSESLSQLPKEELVRIIIEQAIVNTELLSSIQELKQEIERLRVSRDLDSKTSSSPPSTHLLKKPEFKLPETEAEAPSPKRKPGGQPGHTGKTRLGFGRVDRYEILRSEVCLCCGQTAFVDEPVKFEKHQVAQLVERPIEIVEYQRHTCQCQPGWVNTNGSLVTRDHTWARLGCKAASILRMDG